MEAREHPHREAWTWKSSALTRHGLAAENAAACAVRTDRADAHGCGCLDREGRPEVGRLPLSEPPARLTACLDPSVREDRRAPGGGRWLGSFGLRYALDAEDEGDIDLQAHEEPEGRSTPTGSLQAGVDSAVLGHRGR